MKLCDTDGDSAAKVRDYLEPLRRQARKWPEDAFLDFADDFLYEVVLASRQRAGVLSDSVSIVRDFLPILDPTEFSGEARFRLAELFRMICSYEPDVVDHGQIRVDIPRDGGTGAWEILKLAEFRAVVEASGRIGYLRHPLLGFRRLQDRLLALARRPIVKPVLRLASTAADAAGAGGLGGAAGEALGLAADAVGKQFHPPFISVGPAMFPLYRAALREGVPGAAPPDGAIMLFETLRGGRVRHSWLNSGEEGKLEKEAKAGQELRRRKFREARAALDRILT